MRCAKCEFENPAGMKFCGKCRTALGLPCPSCSFENPPGFDFCGKCATALHSDLEKTDGKSAGPKPAAALHVVAEEAFTTLEGERKTVTALFADIKGSMELMEDLDPEEARAMIDPALQADDRRGASLRRLRRAIDRRWHLRVVRRAGRA